MTHVTLRYLDGPSAMECKTQVDATSKDVRSTRPGQRLHSELERSTIL